MPSSLGLYIEDNLIKYAKVSKNNETIKVEAFGVKFYETLSTAIKQIVEETYSFRIPICINTTEEWYNEIQVFSLLAKKDMDNAIKTEFENICYGKEINQNIYEQRYVFTNSYKGDDKINVIHVSVPKTSIEQRKNQLAEYRINSIFPTGICISNLPKKEKKGTVMLVNIEKETTITKIKNGSVSNIEVLHVGAQEILEKINRKENSYSKAYEILKSTTIYTETDKDLQYEDNEYLEDVMPTLFQIVSQIRRNLDESIENVEKIYITGTAAVINNIDIYFQDNLKNVSCEILKPEFISNNSKINIKDYIEVNSAIAIAIESLEKNNKEINFKSESGVNKLVALLNTNISDVGYSEFASSFNGAFSKFSRQLDMITITFALLIISYFVGSNIINNQLKDKMDKANTSINNTKERIAKMQEYNSKFASQTSTYESLIERIQSLSDTNSEDKRYRNTIPNLLNNIMTIIPKNVQIISIKNTSDTHIQITARSQEFQQIAHFKTKIETDGILDNVISDTGRTEIAIEKNGQVQKEVSYLVVTIEGELP